jgi:hypothetical protein
MTDNHHILSFLKASKKNIEKQEVEAVKPAFSGFLFPPIHLISQDAQSNTRG